MKPLPRDARIRPNIDVCDRVERASIDSFPATDPPGWIEGVAAPCPEEYASARERLKGPAKEENVRLGLEAQHDLLGPNPVPIGGFAYRPDLVSSSLEYALVTRFAELEFRKFEFHGFLGNRRVVSFGIRHDFSDQRIHEAPDIPAFLHPLRDLAGKFAEINPSTLQHALVTEYQPGAAIGWHRDRPVFKDVVGISLLSPCRFRLRRKFGATWQRYAITLAPRSAYLLRGTVREHWQHNIPPAEELRYSVTFRLLIEEA